LSPYQYREHLSPHMDSLFAMNYFLCPLTVEKAALHFRCEEKIYYE
jgi:hypothetical protein